MIDNILTYEEHLQMIQYHIIFYSENLIIYMLVHPYQILLILTNNSIHIYINLVSIFKLDNG